MSKLIWNNPAKMNMIDTSFVPNRRYDIFVKSPPYHEKSNNNLKFLVDFNLFNNKICGNGKRLSMYKPNIPMKLE